jgi:hypothetical protein
MSSLNLHANNQARIHQLSNMAKARHPSFLRLAMYLEKFIGLRYDLYVTVRGWIEPRLGSTSPGQEAAGRDRKIL